MDAKYAVLRVVYDKIFRIEHGVPLAGYLQSRTLRSNTALSYSTVQRRGKNVVRVKKANRQQVSEPTVISGQNVQADQTLLLRNARWVNFWNR